jgi:Domain of unknown function (DUF6484)
MIETKDRPRSVAAAAEPKVVHKVANKIANKVDDKVATRATEKNSPATHAAPAITPLAAPLHGIIMGVLVGFDGAMQAQVAFDGNPAPGALPALALAPLGAGDIGKAVALQFERGDLMRPVVIGLLYGSANGQALASPPAQPALQVTQDGVDVTLTAYGRLTLQCGRASITLDASGNIELRGQDILSRAAGQNRVKGSSISLN